MEAYGIEEIAKPIEQDLSAVRALFPHVPARVFKPMKRAPVDILFGVSHFDLHPYGSGPGRDQVGHVRVARSLFGLGWVVAGSHPAAKVEAPRRSDKALAMISLFWVRIKNGRAGLKGDQGSHEGTA